MSTFKLQARKPPLRWWKCRLRANGWGQILLTRFDGDFEKDPDSVTEITYEFFDGTDEEITGVAAAAMEKRGSATWVYMLCDHRPTSYAGWTPVGGAVVLEPPWESRRDELYDVPLQQSGLTHE